jgi:hypothetical protein
MAPILLRAIISVYKALSDMANQSRLLVDIPSDKVVHSKSAGVKGEKRVYKRARYFRNTNGDPRNEAKVGAKIGFQTLNKR